MGDWDGDIDWAGLGFKCGLEIHYQLDTRKKLFCNCPVGLRNDPPDAHIVRHMRPTLSELGEYDGTALMEFKTRKEVHYQLHYDTVCTYEMDDTPPFPLNQEALDIALEIGLLLRCQIADEIHVSRKQYLDGSIPTGFQRTIAVGVNGRVPFRGRDIRIMQLCLEEDACREMRDEGHVIVFRTDRLSTPLAEVITEPDMRTPEEAMEVDRELGRILRATNRVRRGIGSVRQDVNVSIEGGTRVEIKGVPRTDTIEKLTRLEALRQRALLELRGLLERRGVRAESFASATADCTDLLREAGCAPLRTAVGRGGVAGAVRLGGFAGLLRHAVSPRRTFADELRGRVRVVACLDRPPILLHSDAPDEGGVAPDAWRRVRQRLGAAAEDAVVLVWGPRQDVDTALAEIVIRCREATRGVPNETRQVLPELDTDFERILPGPDRMYPDTDSPPLPIPAARTAEVAARLPHPPAYWRERYGAVLHRELLEQLVATGRAPLFDAVVRDTAAPPALVAHLLTAVLTHARRQGGDLRHLDRDFFVDLLQRYAAGAVSRDALPAIVLQAARDCRRPAAEMTQFARLSRAELAPLVAQVAGLGLPLRRPAKRAEHLAGRVRERTGVRADGRDLVALLRSEP